MELGTRVPRGVTIDVVRQKLIVAVAAVCQVLQVVITNADREKLMKAVGAASLALLVAMAVTDPEYWGPSVKSFTSIEVILIWSFP